MNTLADLQDQIALDFDQDSTAPDSTTGEYQRRTKLLNRFLEIWASERNYQWTDLYTTTSLTTTPDQAYITLPTGIEKKNIITSPSGVIRINEYDYTLVNAEDINSLESESRYCYLTGNNAQGLKLYINPVPTDTLTFTIQYYSTALATTTDGTDQNNLSISTDIVKCPDPFYLVYSVLAVLFKTDDDANKGQDYERMAFDRLQAMHSRENLGVRGQGNTIESAYIIAGYPYIGE